MLEGGKPATAEVVKHIDRCLSCLSCMTTCPFGRELHASGRPCARLYRGDLSAALARPTLRSLPAHILPYPNRFRSRSPQPCSQSRSRTRLGRCRLFGARLTPWSNSRRAGFPDARPSTAAGDFKPEGARRGRVAHSLRLRPAGPQTRLQRSRGPAPQPPRGRGRPGRGEGCCGALVHHMGRESEGLAFARRNIDAVDCRDGRGGARRDRDHRVGMRHHHQGLWIHVPGGCRPTRKKPRASPPSPGTSPNT